MSESPRKKGFQSIICLFYPNSVRKYKKNIPISTGKKGRGKKGVFDLLHQSFTLDMHTILLSYYYSMISIKIYVFLSIKEKNLENDRDTGKDDDGKFISMICKV